MRVASDPVNCAGATGVDALLDPAGPVGVGPLVPFPLPPCGYPPAAGAGARYGVCDAAAAPPVGVTNVTCGTVQVVVTVRVVDDVGSVPVAAVHGSVTTVLTVTVV